MGVFGARALGLFLCVRLTLTYLRHNLPQGAARRGPRRPAGHRLPGRRRLHAPDRLRPP